MATKKNFGKCVHCLKDPVELTSDHMFPKAWYPDSAPEMEKWQIPSCDPCNNRYSKVEGDLLNRVALALDTTHPASAGLIDAALRAMNPDAGRDEKDVAARAARAKKILGTMFKGEEIPEDAIMPGLGERWGRPKAEQMAVQIPKASFMDMTEKIVRGLVYREDGAFIETPYKIETYIVNDEGAKVCKEMLDKAGEMFKREPGLEIRRARVDGDKRTGLYEITFWQQFKTYATVSKLDLSKLVDELSSLTVIEAADLARMLQHRWGIS
jgi:Ribosomal protein L7/L12 dimerisation domain